MLRTNERTRSAAAGAELMAGVLLRHRAATLVRSRVLAHGPFPLRCYSRKIEWTAAVLLPKPSHVAAAATFSSGLVLHSLRARQLALCEASLAQHFAAPIIEELDAAEPILQKQSRSSIILEVLACARRAVYLMLVFGPLLIMYPLSRWKVRAPPCRPFSEARGRAAVCRPFPSARPY